MRHIVLDTETTGLEASQGHRVIEIGCIELVNRRQTQRQFHKYLNPEREIDGGALEVHGIDNEFLADKPRFRDIAREFLEFVRDSTLIIHNAPFDVGFIDAELARLGPEWGTIGDYCEVFDTLALARERYPGKRNSLDELCRRLEVDNSQRQLHGALLDAEILLDVYLTMTSGQEDLGLVMQYRQDMPGRRRLAEGERPSVARVVVPEAELAAHERRLDDLEQRSGGVCIWRRPAGADPAE